MQGEFELRFFEIYRSWQFLELLARGAATSAALAVVGGCAGLALATVLASLRYANVPVLAQAAACYVEFIRNTPLIVQLFFVAFGLPLLLGYVWPFWAHAMLALTLNFSAYFSEILRAGLAAVSGSQIEAARALGLSWLATFTQITLPQAFAAMYPSLNSQFIFLFLTTGVIAEIGVEDLTSAGLFIDSRTFRSFEVFITLTVIYVALALAFKMLLKLLERRLFAWQSGA
ncbi:MAG: amino acid ABC transporter permease [Hyphomicrobiaceae bacterium]